VIEILLDMYDYVCERVAILQILTVEAGNAELVKERTRTLQGTRDDLYLQEKKLIQGVNYRGRNARQSSDFNEPWEKL
jgi:hypothetical protein